MMDRITLLRASKNNLLAKIWTPDGSIIPAANAAWFQALEIPVAGIEVVHYIISAVENRPRVALVKEAIAPGADQNHLRRRCAAGVDERTGECFPAGLSVIPRRWIVLDIEKLPCPPLSDFRDGAALVNHVRCLLPSEFKNVACVWQLSGSSGHPSRSDEIRLHVFFMLDQAVFPSAWKSFFAGKEFVDPSAFDKVKLIFTAAPIIHYGKDPIKKRHGLSDGEPVVAVPKAVSEQSTALANGAGKTKRSPAAAPDAPMPEAAAVFVEIIAKANILRSHHPAYRNDRARRLAFCRILREAFGIADEAALAQAFCRACVGREDANGEHDLQQALAWAGSASPSARSFSPRKLLCDASAALHAVNDTETAGRAARLAMAFLELEANAA
jgi:hypothetical protein